MALHSDSPATLVNDAHHRLATRWRDLHDRAFRVALVLSAMAESWSDGVRRTGRRRPVREDFRCLVLSVSTEVADVVVHTLQARPGFIAVLKLGDRPGARAKAVSPDSGGGLLVVLRRLVTACDEFDRTCDLNDMRRVGILAHDLCSAIRDAGALLDASVATAAVRSDN